MITLKYFYTSILLSCLNVTNYLIVGIACSLFSRSTKSWTVSNMLLTLQISEAVSKPTKL